MATLIQKTIGTGGDYPTLTSAISFLGSKDFVTDDEIWQLQILNETITENAGLSIGGMTTDSTRYLQILAASSVYDVSADSGPKITASAAFHTLELNQEYMQIGSGICIESTYAGTSHTVVKIRDPNILVDGATIIRETSVSSDKGQCLETAYQANQDPTVRNCLAIHKGPGDVDGFSLKDQTITVEGCGAIGCTEGINYAASIVPDSRFLVKNCWAVSSSNNDFNDGNASVSATSAFSYCFSEDSTATAFSNSSGNLTPSDIFLDVTAFNFMPVVGEALYEGGIALSEGLLTIDGATRLKTGSWDVGPYEVPVTEIVSSIGSGRDYADVAAWEAATDNDLVAANERHIGILHDSDLGRTFGTATTDAIRYRELRGAQPYDLINGSGVQLSAVGTQACRLSDSDFRLTNLLLHTASSTGPTLQVDGSGCVISSVIISGSDHGLRGNTGCAGLVVVNCIALPDPHANNDYGFEVRNADYRMQNCLAYGWTNEGFNEYTTVASSTYLQNCISIGNGTGFLGSWTLASATNNMSEDSTAPGTAALSGVTSSIFADLSNMGSPDFRIDGSGVGDGVDLSEFFTTDVSGNTYSDPWNIGPYAVSAESGAVAPVADFSGTPLSGEVDLTVSFTDHSTNTPTSWLWDFGDGITSSTQNPSHTYTTVSSYDVTLSATNAGGSDTETKSNYITATEASSVFSISAVVTSGVAPLAVQFRLIKDGAELNSDDFHNIDVTWNSGDASDSRHVSGTAARHIHVYESSGSFTASADIITSSVTSSLTLDITVTDPETEFSGSSTIVISTGSDFTGKPTGATEVTETDFRTSIDTYLEAGKRVLFKRGDVFTSDEASKWSVTVTGPAILGAWGTATGEDSRGIASNNPVVAYSGSGGCFGPGESCDGLRWMDFTLSDAGITSVSPINEVFDGTPDNTLLLRLKADGFYGGMINKSGGGTNIVIADIQNTGTTYKACFYLIGSHIAVIGSQIQGLGNSTPNEHTIRSAGVDYLTILYNNLKHNIGSKEILTIRTDSRWGVIHGNTLTGNDDDNGVLLGIHPQSTSHNESVPDHIIDSNRFIYAGGADPSVKGMDIEAQQISIKNNIALFDGVASSGSVGCKFIVVDYTNTAGSPETTDIWIENNALADVSGLSDGAAGVVQLGAGLSSTTNVLITNNIAVQNGAETPYIAENSGSATITSSNNLTIGTDPLWNAPSSGDFTLSSGSPCIDAGISSLRVRRDASGTLRTGTWDIGPFDESTQTAAASPSSSCNMKVGVNLGNNLYYSDEYAYNDLMKTALQWVSDSTSGGWDDGQPINQDPSGWVSSITSPDQKVATIVAKTENPPVGNYTVIWDGSGTIEHSGDGSYVSSVSAGHDIVYVSGNGGTGYILKITAAPVTNLRIYPEGWDQNQKFRQGFIDRWSDFDTVRFMDWGRTNDSNLSAWSDRIPQYWYTQGDTGAGDGIGGVSIEDMAECANALSANMWYCFPHLATDEFVLSAAQTIKDNLDPDKTLYLEYSNETWNSQFDQEEYVRDQGVLSGLHANQYTARHYYHALRHSEIMDLVSSVYGTDMSAVNRVMASQSNSPSVSKQRFEFSANMAWHRSDSLSIAPYMGGTLGRDPDYLSTLTSSVDQIHEFLVADNTSASVRDNDGDIDEHIDYASGLEINCYEGGQHLAGVGGTATNNDDLTALFGLANSETGMNNVYDKYLRFLEGKGISVYVNYAATAKGSKNGWWGVVDFHDASSAVGKNKYTALTDFISNCSSTPYTNFSGTPTSGAPGVSVAFTDRSEFNATSWNWDFGDGTSSTSQNPTHIYSTSGGYTVTLSSTGDHGEEYETKTNYITVASSVTGPPTADFSGTPLSAAPNDTITFTDYSTESPSAWSWSFGDGNTSSTQNPTHSYSAVGLYTVTLSATNASGTDEEVKTNYITISAAPTADFSGTPTSGEAPLEVTFTDYSTESPSAWSWNFGDGNTSSTQNPAHTYSSSGTYTVTLSATNFYGTDAEVKTNYITVDAAESTNPPVADFSGTPLNGSAPLEVTFTDYSTESPSSWAWNFGDGNTSSVSAPVHTYSANGNYTVTLSATNAFGTDEEVKTNYITVSEPTGDEGVNTLVFTGVKIYFGFSDDDYI